MTERSPRGRIGKPRILIVGCGDVGMRLARQLMPRFAIIGTCRSEAHASALRALGVSPLRLDLDAPVPRLPHAPWVVHLAPPSQQGERDLRTRRLLQRLSPPRRLVYVSTSGVYGDCGGALIDETWPPAPRNARARRRLDAEVVLRAYARLRSTRLSIVRVPGIYAEERLPRERLRQGLPALEASQDVYTNHIHADDLAAILAAALFAGRPQRIYHASDDSVLRMGEYFDLIADRLGLPRPPRVARGVLAEHLSPVQLSFMQESRRLANQRLKQELGVTLRYPTVVDFLTGRTADSLQ